MTPRATYEGAEESVDQGAGFKLGQHDLIDLIRSSISLLHDGDVINKAAEETELFLDCSW